MNTRTKRDQTPIKFGSETDRFIIADLTLIFEEREKERLKKELEDKAKAFSFENISFVSEIDGSVKSLPGFIKGRHRVPSIINSSTDSFIKTIGHKLIQDEISEISQELQKYLKYPRAILKASAYSGSGSIETPDFDYDINIYQSEEDPEMYILSRKLEYIKNPEIINNPFFNQIFSSTFDNLKLSVNKSINISKLIDKIEKLEEQELFNLDYDPSDLSSLTISLAVNSHSIYITSDSISIRTISKSSPSELVAAYQKTQKILVASPVFKMLNQ
jgi:hypothetical protein